MRMKFFAIPALTPEPAAAELATFLASHRVLAIDRHLVTADNASYWALCVTYQQASTAPQSGKRPRVDYREVLSEEDFAVYARLRELRKTLAQREAVPVYAVFTNEQLAVLAQQRPTSKQALAKIPGVGAARVQSYGEPVLELIRAGNSKPGEAPKEDDDAAS